MKNKLIKYGALICVILAVFAATCIPTFAAEGDTAPLGTYMFNDTITFFEVGTFDLQFVYGSESGSTGTSMIFTDTSLTYSNSDKAYDFTTNAFSQINQKIISVIRWSSNDLFNQWFLANTTKIDNVDTFVDPSSVVGLWKIKDDFILQSISYQMTFISNGQTYEGFNIGYSGSPAARMYYINYLNTPLSINDRVYSDNESFGFLGWKLPQYQYIDIVSMNSGQGYSSFVKYLQNNAEKVVEETSPTDNILDVWTSILEWLMSSFNTVQGLFFSNGELTLLGTLCTIGLAVSIVFLAIGLIQRFLHLRS